MAFTGKPPGYLEREVSNDAFYPTLSIGDFQKQHRVPAELAPIAVEHQLTLARNHVNAQLFARKATWTQNGVAHLADLDTPAFSFSHTYVSAIFLRAKAKLLMDYQTFSRRDTAENMATERDEIEQRLLSDSRLALRKIMGAGGLITAELL